MDKMIYYTRVISLLIAATAIVYYINTLDGQGSQMWEGQGWALKVGEYFI